LNVVSPQEKHLYDSLFASIAGINQETVATGPNVVNLFKTSGLSQKQLADIWIKSIKSKGRTLSRAEFYENCRRIGMA